MKNTFVLLLLLSLPFTAKTQPEVYSKGKGISISEFFTGALTEKQFSIALCKVKPFEELYMHGEYVPEKELGWLIGKTGRLQVVESIKGSFIQTVVYYEYFYSTGRKWPAFGMPVFHPPDNTEWIVVFRRDEKDEKIKFKNSDKEIPILRLACKDYGIIRFDADNHLSIDAGDFRDDLVLLVNYLDVQDVELPSVQMKTDLGKEILVKIENIREKSNSKKEQK